MIRAGLAGGVSPGFRVPPASVVANAEAFEPEPGNPGVQVRVINQAVLHELSHRDEAGILRNGDRCPGVRYRAAGAKAAALALATLAPWPTTPAANADAVACLATALGIADEGTLERLGSAAAALVERHAPGRAKCDQERGDNPMRGLARAATCGVRPFRERW